MISPDHLRQIAFWSHDLREEELERARRGITEKPFSKGAYICHRGDRLEHWTGVVSGLIKLSTISAGGKAVTLAGVRAGGWFGEGSVLKDEPRQYDLVALRDTRIAMMNRATFFWLFENSIAFNRFLVHQFNERLGQFIALVEYDRMLDAPGRFARNIAWLFNPALQPGRRHDARPVAGGARAAVRRVAAGREQVPADLGGERPAAARARRDHGARSAAARALRRIVQGPGRGASHARDQTCGRLSRCRLAKRRFPGNVI